MMIEIIRVGAIIVLVLLLNIYAVNTLPKIHIVQNRGNGLANSPWPCYKGDERRTGQSHYDTSNNTGKIKWKIRIDDGLSSPAIGRDGTVYVVASYHRVEYLYAIGNVNETGKSWDMRVIGIIIGVSLTAIISAVWIWRWRRKP